MGKEYCPFCDENVIKNQSLYSDNLCFVLYNYMPVNPGHVMIIPKRHASDVRTLSEHELGEMFLMLKQVYEKIDSHLLADRYSFQINEGIFAGQEVFHCHLHFVPRYKHDTYFQFEQLKNDRIKVKPLSDIYKKATYFKKHFEFSNSDSLNVFETDYSLVYLLDKSLNNGHMFVRPKRLVENLSECDDLELIDLARVVRKCSFVLNDILKPDGFNYRSTAYPNLSLCFGVEVLPRYKGDAINRAKRKLKMSYSHQKLSSKELLEHVKRFKALF